MWLHRTRLPHVLAPSAYHDPDWYERELARVFAPGWHFVATTAELPRPVDRLVRSTLGHAITVQRAGDRFDAWVSPAGAPRHTAPCRLERLGALLFASFAPDGPSLREHLGERSSALAERLFTTAHELAVRRELRHPCNWKIPLENVLESYHVPSLHRNVLARYPDLFRVFGSERRASSDVVHELGDRFTVYRDTLGADSALYRSLIDRLTPGADVAYVHHHAFPGLVLAHTSIVSFLQVVEPTSPTTSRSSIRLFLSPAAGPLGSLLRPALRAASALLIDLVLREDAAVYPDVQRGLESSPHPGVLGSREERIHAFHTFLDAACREPAHAGLAAGQSTLPP